ncbi:MAG TPA: LPS assembly lipoprotein LptE [Bryobacteraceae bacterium]|nr:LPS assembly lipoprotein LptE [Bryobacteraceae bacterium]
MSGCGYHVAANADLLPKNIKTIAVPAFGNATTRYTLARRLPEDITREFLSRTRYAVVSDPAKADAVVTGAILNAFAYPTTADPVSGRATGIQAIVTLSLNLVDRATGKVIWTRPSAEFRERYELAIDPAQYFDESSTAMIRLSRDVARSVVSEVLEQF